MRHFRWIIGFAISGVALYIAFRGVDWSGVVDGFKEANYWLLLAALPFLIGLLVMKAQRWRLLFYPEPKVPFMSAFGALTIGYMTGTILPLQLGEIARAYVLGEATGIKKMRVLSTVAVERVLDTLVLLLLLGLLMPFVPVPRYVALGAALILIPALLAGGVIAMAVRDRTHAEHLLDRLVRLLPTGLQVQARAWRTSLLDGLSALAYRRVTLQVVAWTIGSWTISSVAMYLMMEAFSLDVPMAAAPFLLVATTFGFFVPSSPGAIGVWDAISIRTLTEIFSVDHAAATSFALVAHAMYSIPPTILGAFFLLIHQYSLRRITSSEPVEVAAPQLEAPVLADANPQG